MRKISKKNITLDVLAETMNRGFVALEKNLEKNTDKKISSLAGMVQRGFLGVDKRFDEVDKRIDGIDKRIDGIDKRIDGLDNKVDVLYLEVSSMSKKMNKIDERLTKKLRLFYWKTIASALDG